MFNSAQSRQTKGGGFWVLALLTISFFPQTSFAAADKGLDLSVSSVSGAPGSSVAVSVAGDFGQPVNSIQFSLKFNADLLAVSGVTTGSANKSWTIVNNPKIPGTVIVGMFNIGGKTAAVAGADKEIAVINFTISKASKTPAIGSDLTLSKVSFDTSSVTKLSSGKFIKK